MILFDHVSKVYPNGTVGLRDVDLTIRDGEFVAIIGRSGAGKSTLLRAVNRMHSITGGKLTVEGVDVSALRGKELRRFRRGIGMVFQSFNLVTRTTVIRNVLSARVPDLPFWRVVLGAFRREDKLAALEALDKVGILDKAYIRADQLSGGQQQRVALARTLAQDPKIILADEPVAALDPVTAKQVMQDFVRINKDLGISILLNIHHLRHESSSVRRLQISLMTAAARYISRNSCSLSNTFPSLQFLNPADSVHVCGCYRPPFQNGRYHVPEPLPPGRNKGEISESGVVPRPIPQERNCPICHFFAHPIDGNISGFRVNLPTNRNQLHFFAGLCGSVLPLLPAIANFARVQVCAAPRAFPVRLPHDDRPFLFFFPQFQVN